MRLIAISSLFLLALSTGAYSLELSPGTYVGKFPGGCGNLTVKSGGKSVDYTYGPCGGAPTYHHGGSFDGKTISIQAARIKVGSADSSKIKGTWTLGSYITGITFKRK